MSFLINRTPPARLRCLHSLIKFAYAKFGLNEFRMGGLLYDKNEDNIHNYCKILNKDENLNIKYCPFLQNPLSMAGCYLTRGVSDDSTKKKEISNSVNSLDALDLIDRKGRILKITKLGEDFAKADFNSKEWLQIAKKAVCNYGLAVGLLYQIEQSEEIINTKNLVVGYPNSNEYISTENEMIELSSGSQKDSNTRTRSCLLAWFTTVGFIIPASLRNKINLEQSQIDTEEYIISNATRNESSYYKGKLPKIFNNKFITKKPLDYKNLTKDNTALRENGQENSRRKTMEYAHIIRNRRFAILYCLNYCFENNYLLNFKKLIKELEKYKNLFLIEKKNFSSVMQTELAISTMSGIPVKIINEDLLKPTTGLNLEILTVGAPEDLVDLLKTKILKEIYEVSLQRTK